MKIRIEQPDDIRHIRKLYSTLLDPSLEIVNFLAEQSNTLPSSAFTEALRTFAKQATLPSPPDPKGKLPSPIVRTNHDGRWTYYKPSRFQLGIWVCEVASTWRDVIRSACDILYIEHRDTFVERVKPITGPRGRSYFSTHPKHREDAYEVGHIYVETSLTANNSVSLLNKLAQFFGYEKPVIETQTCLGRP